MSNKIEIKQSTSFSGSNYYLLNVNDKLGAVANTNPFGNCQSWSIKYFNVIVSAIPNKKDMRDAINIMKRICNISKPLLIVDLNRQYYNSVKDHLHFHSILPYTNSNGSDMVYCVIDTRK
jgi:hypothetical protein